MKNVIVVIFVTTLTVFFIGCGNPEAGAETPVKAQTRNNIPQRPIINGEEPSANQTVSTRTTEAKRRESQVKNLNQKVEDIKSSIGFYKEILENDKLIGDEHAMRHARDIFAKVVGEVREVEDQIERLQKEGDLTKSSEPPKPIEGLSTTPQELQKLSQTGYRLMLQYIDRIPKANRELGCLWEGGCMSDPMRVADTKIYLAEESGFSKSEFQSRKAKYLAEAKNQFDKMVSYKKELGGNEYDSVICDGIKMFGFQPKGLDVKQTEQIANAKHCGYGN